MTFYGAFSFCHIRIKSTPGLMVGVNVPPSIPGESERPEISLNDASDDYNFGVEIDLNAINPADVKLVNKANWWRRSQWILTWSNGTVAINCRIAANSDVNMDKTVVNEICGNKLILKAARN